MIKRHLHNESVTERNPVSYRLSVVAHYIVWGCLALVISNKFLLPAMNAVLHFGISDKNGITTIMDFASFFNFTKAFWLDHHVPGISAYSVTNHLHVTSDWLGKTSMYSLSFGYSPTMLWFLAPLILFSHSMAFCVFNSAGLLAVWWQTQPKRCRFGLGMLAFMSPLAMSCFQVGQTALLTGAGLLFLFEQSRSGFERIVSRQTALASLVLWALTSKPPLALAAGTVLLALRQWRPVMLAALLALVTTLAISPFLGPGWIVDYLNLIATYNRVQADPAFALGYFPPHMANLRGVLSVDFNLPDDIASRISSFIWVAALAGLVAAGPRLRMAVGGFWSIGVLLYLLFCPHVSSMEVLQVVLLLPFCIPAHSARLECKELVLLLAVPLLPFTSPVQLDNRVILFSGLLCVLGFVFAGWREKIGNFTGTI